MAKIPDQAESTWLGPKVEHLPPAGNHVGVILKEYYDPQKKRQKYQKPNEFEVVPMVRYALGFKTKDGQGFIALSQEMVLSQGTKANFRKFFEAATGRAPETDEDTEEVLIGLPISFRVEHKTAKESGNTYHVVSNVGGLPDIVASNPDLVPQASEFKAILESVENGETEKSESSEEEEAPY